jgi:hypothetical protein
LKKCTVQGLSSENLDDWVRVYNQGHQMYKGFVPFTEGDLTHMLRNKIVDSSSMYLGLEGVRPAATGCLCFPSQSDTAILTDFSVVPGMHLAASALIEHCLKISREKHARALVNWVPEVAVAASDALGDFTFEPYQVHLILRNALLLKPEYTPVTSITVNEMTSSEKNPTIPELPQLLRECLDLREVRDIEAKCWQPRVTAVDDAAPSLALIGFVSKSNRREAWIQLMDSEGSGFPDIPPSEGLIQEVLAVLFKKGVRGVRTEIRSEFRVKSPFMSADFEVTETIYELILPLSHT